PEVPVPSHKVALGLALISVAVGACGPEESVPANPTWVGEVQPILRGNCFNCHGVTASITKFRTKRWDVCDLKAFAALGFEEDPKGEFVGANSRLPVAFHAYLLPPPGQTRPNMPPMPG